MPLYRWKSEALSYYQYGDIFVLAADVDSARTLVLDKVKFDCAESHPDFLADQLEIFTRDISVEPDTSIIHFISGGS